MSKLRPNFITIEEALLKIKDEDHVVSGLAGAEPRMLLSRLHEIHEGVNGIRIMTCLPMGNYEFYRNPNYKSTFLMEGWFYSGAMRQCHDYKTVTFIPNHLHFSAKKRIDFHKPNVYVGNCSLVDEHGYVSLGLSAVYEREMIEVSDMVILEMNPNVPRTFGDTTLHISQVDYFIKANYQMPELPLSDISDRDRKIGKFIADLIEDGSTIQLGIGGIPNAVADALKTKKHLGIHTEMFTDGMVDLYKAGAIDNTMKTLHKGKMVAAFALGSEKLYKFIDNNPGVLILDGAYVNDPYIIGQNHKMVSINTSIEVDLTGQCCSESIGSKQISGTGGQADTAIGAQNSRGGKSFIALYSTTLVKDPDSGKMVEKSKIVPTLTQGAIVSLSRNDVDYVVTEYGVAALRGTSIRDRVDRLIEIAHPDYRDWLHEEAEKNRIW